MFILICWQVGVVGGVEVVTLVTPVGVEDVGEAAEGGGDAERGVGVAGEDLRDL